jgi:general secretion pathway protein L
MQVFHMIGAWRWWITEIGPLLPRQDPRPVIARMFQAEIHIAQDQVALHRQSSPAFALEPQTCAAAGEGLESIAPSLRCGEKVVLSVDDDVCFCHELTVPAQARGNFAQLLANELARITPFEPDEIVAGWYEEPSQDAPGSVDLRQIVIRRSIVSRAIAEVRRAGATVEALVVRNRKTAAYPFALAVDGRPFGEAATRRWAKLAATGVALFFFGMGALAASLLLRQGVNFAELEHKIAGLQTAAAEVRGRLAKDESRRAEAAALQRRRQDDVSLLILWEELSRLMPDTAWLQSLSKSGAQITMEGMAKEAEPLIAAVESSPLFTQARFVAPVVKAGTDSAVRFAVTFEVRPEKAAHSP